MAAIQHETVQDLLLSSDELIDGEIVRRPMTRARHARAQSQVNRHLGTFDDGARPGGWWILTEISVAYEAHECPCHDIAGWRRERLPRLPDGPIGLPPDWVCEIVSPGHEKKDTRSIPLLLRRHRVPCDWVTWSEHRALVAYALDEGERPVVATLGGRTAHGCRRRARGRSVARNG
ncbi:Uma2 family endonuclease [Thiococcus pfennigii]|uniref:Uma2 family endonuclease n=1 Tax=Thiococcus pfennigii TaxID=1057 RepID=UPI001F5BB2E7|nr:Uma2 family endonuclease [Thiococcus pfennigii]MBK1731145.1 hypothetical protein [Thiococcus pfennigii]